MISEVSWVQFHRFISSKLSYRYVAFWLYIYKRQIKTKLLGIKTMSTIKKTYLSIFDMRIRHSVHLKIWQWRGISHVRCHTISTINWIRNNLTSTTLARLENRRRRLENLRLWCWHIIPKVILLRWRRNYEHRRRQLYEIKIIPVHRLLLKKFIKLTKKPIVYLILLIEMLHKWLSKPISSVASKKIHMIEASNILTEIFFKIIVGSPI